MRLFAVNRIEGTRVKIFFTSLKTVYTTVGHFFTTLVNFHHTAWFAYPSQANFILLTLLIKLQKPSKTAFSLSFKNTFQEYHHSHYHSCEIHHPLLSQFTTPVHRNFRNKKIFLLRSESSTSVTPRQNNRAKLLQFYFPRSFLTLETLF